LWGGVGVFVGLVGGGGWGGFGVGGGGFCGNQKERQELPPMRETVGGGARNLVPCPHQDGNKKKKKEKRKKNTSYNEIGKKKKREQRDPPLTGNIKAAVTQTDMTRRNARGKACDSVALNPKVWPKSPDQDRK